MPRDNSKISGGEDNHATALALPVDERKKMLLRVLSETGDMRLARRKSATTQEEFEQWLDSDPNFRMGYTRARREAVDRLEEEAFHRAIHGTEEPVIKNGQVVGSRVRYSDTLLMFLLKSLKPDVYGDRPTGRPTSVSFNLQAVNLAQSMSAEELQRLRSALLLEQKKRKRSRPKPAHNGVEVIDAEIATDDDAPADA